MPNFAFPNQTKKGLISNANDEMPLLAHTNSVVPVPEKGSITQRGV